MTVYLYHLDMPLFRGTARNGTPLLAGHYMGETNDLIRRTMEHAEGKGSRFTQV